MRGWQISDIEKLSARGFRVNVPPIPKNRVKSKESDKKLWEAFSIYIRVRDSDDQGICTCFTCGRKTIWNKNTDCGHGIGRQHLGVKYSEINNHAQCKGCNGFEGGKREVYKARVNQKYGVGTWDLLEALSRKVTKLSQFEIDEMEKHYRELGKKIMIVKGL